MSTPPGPTPDRAPVPATPLVPDRLQGSIPVDRARARRTLWSLALGHLAVLVGAVGFATLIAWRAATTDPPFVDPALELRFVVGSLFLVAGQILSVRKLRVLARAITDRIDIDQVARSLRRSELSVLVAWGAIIVALQSLFSTTPLPAPPLSVAYQFLIVGSLLLDQIYCGSIHGVLGRADSSGSGAGQRLLPRGINPRIGNGQLICHALLGGIAALLLVATVVTEFRTTTNAPLAVLVQILAAAGATTAPFLHIRPALLVRAATAGDGKVHLPTLQRAGPPLIRAAAITVPLTALVIAAILAAPAAPVVAAGRALLLGCTISIAVFQFLTLSSLYTGDTSDERLRADDPARRGILRRHPRPARSHSAEPVVGGAAADPVGDDRAGAAVPAALTSPPPLACPGCGLTDQVQYVPALYRGALANYRGSGPTPVATGGIAVNGLAASLSPPIPRTGGVQALGCALVATAVMTVLVGVFMELAAPLPVSSAGDFARAVLYYMIVLLPGAAIFAALLSAYVSLRRRADRRREQVSSAIEAWRSGCYCHRCGGAFFPTGTGRNVPTGRLMSTGEYRHVVQQADGRDRSTGATPTRPGRHA